MANATCSNTFQLCACDSTTHLSIRPSVHWFVCQTLLFYFVGFYSWYLHNCSYSLAHDLGNCVSGLVSFPFITYQFHWLNSDLVYSFPNTLLEITSIAHGMVLYVVVVRNAARQQLIMKMMLDTLEAQSHNVSVWAGAVIQGLHIAVPDALECSAKKWRESKEAMNSTPQGQIFRCPKRAYRGSENQLTALRADLIARRSTKSRGHPI